MIPSLNVVHKNKNSFRYHGSVILNSLSIDIRDDTSLILVISKISSYKLNGYPCIISEAVVRTCSVKEVCRPSSCNSIKNTLPHRCFLKTFAKLLRYTLDPEIRSLLEVSK